MTASGSGKKGSVGQGILVLMILLGCVGVAGFAVGYTQKFAPIEMVAPESGSASSSQSGTNAASSSSSSQTSNNLKKAYWIQTSGWDRAGYAIKVYINEQMVGTFQTEGRIEDVTKYVKAGENKIRFQAKALPQGNRNDYSGARLTLKLYQGEKFSSKGYKDGESLVEYTRKVTETDDYDDTMDFAAIE